MFWDAVHPGHYPGSQLPEILSKCTCGGFVFNYVQLLESYCFEHDVHVQQRCQSDTHPMKPRLSFAQGPAPKCPRTGARHRGPVRRSSFPVDGRGDDVARGFSSVVLHPKTSLPRLSADRNGKSAIGHVTGCCPMLPVLVMST